MTPAVCLPGNWKFLIKNIASLCNFASVKCIYTHIYIRTTSSVQIYIELQRIIRLLVEFWHWSMYHLKKLTTLKEIFFASGTNLHFFSRFEIVTFEV